MRQDTSSLGGIHSVVQLPLNGHRREVGSSVHQPKRRDNDYIDQNGQLDGGEHAQPIALGIAIGAGEEKSFLNLTKHTKTILRRPELLST